MILEEKGESLGNIMKSLLKYEWTKMAFSLQKLIILLIFPTYLKLLNLKFSFEVLLWKILLRYSLHLFLRKYFHFSKSFHILKLHLKDLFILSLQPYFFHQPPQKKLNFDMNLNKISIYKHHTFTTFFFHHILLFTSSPLIYFTSLLSHFSVFILLCYVYTLLLERNPFVNKMTLAYHFVYHLSSRHFNPLVYKKLYSDPF